MGTDAGDDQDPVVEEVADWLSDYLDDVEEHIQDELEPDLSRGRGATDAATGEPATPEGDG